MRFVNRTKSNTALIETALTEESLYLIDPESKGCLEKAKTIAYTKCNYRESPVSAVSISAVFDLVRFTNRTK